MWRHKHCSIMKVILILISFESYVLSKLNLAKYGAAWKKFLTYIWVNAGYWKLVPDPFMILLRRQYSNTWLFLINGLYHFKMPLTYIEWLLSYWSRFLSWKGPGSYPQFSKLFKRFLKIIVLAYINPLAKSGDLMSCGSKELFKNPPCLMTEYSLWRHRFGT